MDTFERLQQTEPAPDLEDTQKLAPPVFALAGMGQMVAFLSPEGRELWVLRGSPKYQLFVSHRYQQVKK